MRFCLLIVLAALADGCSAESSANQDPNAPIRVETTQMYITVRNDSGLSLNEVSVAIVPVGRSTIYNRFNRWSRQGIWFEMFEALTGSTGIIGTVAIDSSHIKAHRSAAGGKGGPSGKPSAARAAGERRKSTH